MRCVLLAVCLLFAAPVEAADLYAHDNWPALATDRTAHKLGDILTIVVYENSTATNTANSDSKRSTSLGGEVSAGTSFDKSANLSLAGGSGNTGSTGRSGQMVAQISVAVDEVLPGGDLHVSGAQLLDINGEKTNIRIKGRVRSSDISSANVVLSSRLADAQIDYDGSGFVSSSAQPGVVTRVFNWLGIP
jgi:flagellar L-ring protein precursor FlgH